jgi:hypothetical protein
MILKGLAVVAFFANVRASSFCVHLPCPVCIQSVVRGDEVVCLMVIKGLACKRPNNFISIASIRRVCESIKVQFSDPHKNVGKTKVLCSFKIVSVLIFLKIFLVIETINCRNFASLISTSLETW